MPDREFSTVKAQKSDDPVDLLARIAEISRSGVHVVEQVLALDASGAYADGDVFGDVFSIADACRSPLGSGLLQEITVLDFDDQGFGLDILLFKGNPTVQAKNAAWAVSDAEMLKCLGLVQVSSGDFLDLGGNRIATKSGLGIGIKPTDGTTLYVATRIRGAGTYTASGVKLKLTFLRD